MLSLWADLRLAMRNLSRSPGFTAVAAATLALGIGANTAIFSIVDAVLLKPLPYRNPDQLVKLYETESAPGKYPFAGPDFLDWKKQNTTFQDMALFRWTGAMNLSGRGEPQHVTAVPTEANFFSLLGAAPALGRTWAPGEDQPGKDRVVVLSYSLWRSHFGGDPKVVGQALSLNSAQYTIIGVMPQGFRYPSRVDLWVPLDMDSRTLGARGNHSFRAIGRLKPGVAVKKAQAELTLIAARLEKQFPDSNYKVGALVMPLREDLTGQSRSSLLLITAAVALVLLIACANVANLLLSRALGRQKEMAIRGALGAGRGRLVRQLLTESVTLSTLGGALGLGLGWLAVSLFGKVERTALPEFALIQLDWRALAFTFSVALVTGVLFGIFPAIRTSRPDMHDELKGGAGSVISAGRGRRFTSNALVAGEIALSMMLLASAGLLLKDFERVRRIDFGVRTEGLWTAAIQLPESGYETGQARFNFAQSLLERAWRVPGVRTAALTDRLPLEGGSNYYAAIRGRPFQPMSGPLVERHSVSPGYFTAMGVRVLQGRVFTAEDTQTAIRTSVRLRQLREQGAIPPSVSNDIVYPSVINEAMARYFWPNQSPLGQMFSSGSPNGPWNQVIGVVSDVRQRGLTRAPEPEAYDALQSPQRIFLVLRTTMRLSGMTEAARRLLAKIDPALPLYDVRTMEDVVADNSVDQRFLSVLVGAFAGLAALLAAIGIYGVLSYAVTQRTREIGIRMSLGASRGRILAEVLRQAMALALVGFAAGIAGAIAAGRIFAGLLHEVKPGDPWTIAATACLLAAVALAACYIPARRAARLDPMNALRYE